MPMGLRRRNRLVLLLALLVSAAEAPAQAARKDPFVRLTTPAEGVVVTTLRTVAAGRVEPPDAAVSINAIPAEVQSGTFLANDLPLEPGDNAVTAVSGSLAHTRLVRSEPIARACKGAAVFGPRGYLRRTGSPVWERVSFSVPAPGDGYLLKMQVG
ncbi:MAG: hypothetical protein ACE5JI_14275, partial [Acidobacteriota bacterium]